MKLLLRKDISRLGIVGDVVEVSDGYARNYLLPQHLATEPTEVNIRALAEERKKAEAQRRTLHEAQIALAETLRSVEVTIAAAANEEGALYGSVGPREIAAALREEGHDVEARQVNLHTPIRRLDNVPVEVMLAEGITAEVKVWVVRSRGMALESEDSEQDPAKARGQHADTEAGPDGDSPNA